MHLIPFTAFEWILLVQHELTLFAAVFFALGAADEIAVDASYVWLALTGRLRTVKVDERVLAGASLQGQVAVFLPAWREAEVIGATLRHALSAWPDPKVRLYVGCYRNDPETVEAAIGAIRGDPRARVVINEAHGPTSKADCLNRLYVALREDELRQGEVARMVVLHDAEDMVDPVALAVMDRAIGHYDFVQLPVLALPQRRSRWIGSHYSDEFAEAHAKTMVVRDALGAAVPGAGVGSAIARPMLDRLARAAGDGLPFARHSLTEDYELGLLVAALGGRGRFCASARGRGVWSPRAPISRTSSPRPSGRRRAGCTASPCRAGTGLVGRGDRSTAGCNCATGVGRLLRFLLPSPMSV